MKNEKENKFGFFKYKYIFKWIVIAVITAVFIFIYTGINQKSNQNGYKKKQKFKNLKKYKSEGGGMEYFGFNKKNEKTLKIKCDYSEETKDNKIFMENIVASFTPKSRTKNEVIISGDKGIVENNLYNFTITGNAKIKSDDFSISSVYFKLENKDVLTTEKFLDYSAKNIQGKANSMKIHLDDNILSFFESKGFYKIKKKKVKFNTARLHIDDDNQTVSFKKLKKINIVYANDFFLKGERILTKFSENYKVQLYTKVRHDCHFNMKKKPIDSDNFEYRDIKAKYINLYYSESGDIASIDSRDNTKVNLTNKSNFIDIHTNYFEMIFYKEKQTIKSISLRSTYNDFKYKDLEVEKDDDYQLKGYEINILYNEDGKISKWEVLDDKNAKLVSDKYLCDGKSIKYKLIDSTVIIKNNAKVEIEKKNIFRSEELIIDTENEKLSSKKPVLAKIILEQKSVLLSKNPIYINSDLMEIDEKKKTMRFEGNVSLIQDDVSIKTNKLIISEKNGIKCESLSNKKSAIVFVNNNKEVVLSGEKIEFNKKENKIKIAGKAVLNNERNKIEGNSLIINFKKEEINEINGEGDIVFNKDKMHIESESVKWLYDIEFVYFYKLKTIEQKETGSIKGKKIKLDLKTNKMTVISDTDERTEMILE